MNGVIHKVVRSFASLMALALTASPLFAAAWSLPADAASRPHRETLWGLPRDDPAIAVGAIVAALLLFAFIAWIAARVGDKS